jgi:hypothetical protein
MHPSFKRFFGARRRALLTATLLASALVSPTLKPLAQDSQQVTRPRRATQADAWPTPTPDTITLPTIEPPATVIKSEPLVRVGLATNARSVTVSTNGRLLNATDASAAPIPFEVARIRIEPRAYPPMPAPDASADGVETATSSSTLSSTRTASNSDTTTRGASTRASAPTSNASGAARSGVQLTSRASAPVRGAALYVGRRGLCSTCARP